MKDNSRGKGSNPNFLGISSVEMLRVREMEMMKEGSAGYRINQRKFGTRYGEIVPDWFWKRKREEADMGELLREYLAERADLEMFSGFLFLFIKIQ